MELNDLIENINKYGADGDKWDFNKVGYKNPPKESRFKKGQSGNKKGRPIGSTNTTTLFEKEFAINTKITENGKELNINKKKLVVKQIVNGAIKGNQRCIKLCLEFMRKCDKKKYIETHGAYQIDLSGEFDDVKGY